MKERDVHNLIEQQDEEGKKALYVRVCGELGLETKVKSAPRSKRALLWRVLVPALSACIICLAIILPIALKNRVDPNPNRYNLSSDCVSIELDVNIKDYARKNNKPIMYVDWYDIAEDVVTCSYVNKKDKNDLIYLEEQIANIVTGDIVRLSIFEKYMYLDTFENLLTTYNEVYYKNISLKWEKTVLYVGGMIEYGDYRYYVQIVEPSEAIDMVEILKGMVDTVVK